jgi:putative endonuclease
VDNHLYAGVTTDVKRRFKEHKSLGPKAAKYLRAHRPQALVFSKVIGSRSLALKVEYRFKQLTKRDKEAIVRRKKMKIGIGPVKITFKRRSFPGVRG